MSIAIGSLLVFGASQVGTPGPANMALLATGAGLGVAIVAVLFYNYFQSRLQSAETRLDRTASELSEAFFDRK